MGRDLMYAYATGVITEAEMLAEWVVRAGRLGYDRLVDVDTGSTVANVK